MMNDIIITMRDKMKQKILILLAILFLCGIYSFSQTNSEVEPVQIVQDINLNEYIPFKANSKVASLNGNSSYKLFGIDAFVFFVNKMNPINNISSKQIRGIYSKEITNWKDVGGENADIIPYQRPKDSGSQTIMEI